MYWYYIAFYFMLWQRNLRKKYPNSCLDSLTVNCCHVPTLAMNKHFCSIMISDFMECEFFYFFIFFFGYNDYVQSIHLQNFTLNNLFAPVSDFSSYFLVIIRLYIQGIHTIKPISWLWNKSHSAEYATNENENWYDRSKK